MQRAIEVVEKRLSDDFVMKTAHLETVPTTLSGFSRSSFRSSMAQRRTLSKKLPVDTDSEVSGESEILKILVRETLAGSNEGPV